GAIFGRGTGRATAALCNPGRTLGAREVATASVRGADQGEVPGRTGRDGACRRPADRPHATCRAERLAGNASMPRVPSTIARLPLVPIPPAVSELAWLKATLHPTVQPEILFDGIVGPPCGGGPTPAFFLAVARPDGAHCQASHLNRAGTTIPAAPSVSNWWLQIGLPPPSSQDERRDARRSPVPATPQSVPGRQQPALGRRPGATAGRGRLGGGRTAAKHHRSRQTDGPPANLAR